MKEAYCTFEIAELLKKKGFEEPCFAFWEYELCEYSLYISSEHFIKNSELESELKYSAPTHQMAMAWLREKHLIHVYAEHKAFLQESPKKLYYHWKPFIKTLPHCPINKSGFYKDTMALDVYCDNYEDAIEAALLYTLENLI